MTKPGPFDLHRDGKRQGIEGKTACDFNRVVQNLIEHDCDLGHIMLIAGAVEETLKLAKHLPTSIAALRLDTDWHSSTAIALEVLYPRLIHGGVLIVDDYGHWLGAKKAVDDYFKRKGRIKFSSIDYTAIIAIKP
jgi:hypothetical protein